MSPAFPPDSDTTALFTPSEVEARTGVPAATLRQWERRYGFPAPSRNASGYRLYSPRDLAQIEEMRGHLRAGVTASRAAQLIRASVPPAPQGASAAELVQLLLAADTSGAAALLSDAHAHLSVEDVLLKVMAPALAECGRRWENGEIRIAQVHQAAAFLRGRVSALLELAGRGSFGPHLLAACPPGEEHEIGLMMVTLVLRRQGARVEYLGTNLPLGDLALYARQRQADALLLSLSGEWAWEAARAGQGELTALDVPLFYGGALLNAQPALAPALGGRYAGPDARAASDIILGHLRQNR